MWGEGFAGEFLSGGDDYLDGGDGDDLLVGDGDAVDPISEESETGIRFVGGNDYLYGKAGNDVLFGDSLITPDGEGFLGGNDALFGGDGFDDLYGQGGNDYLCAGSQNEDGPDIDSGYGGDIFGGEGVDLACAHNDAATVTSGTPSYFALAANDERLDDEGFGCYSSDDEFDTCGDYEDPPFEGGLLYALLAWDPWINITGFNEFTGEVTYTATQSGIVRYSVTRQRPGVGDEFELFDLGALELSLDDPQALGFQGEGEEFDGSFWTSVADFVITVVPPSTGKRGKKHHHHDDDDDGHHGATLPNTGAPDSSIAGGGLVLLLGGLGLVGATRRRVTERV